MFGAVLGRRGEGEGVGRVEVGAELKKVGEGVVVGVEERVGIFFCLCFFQWGAKFAGGGGG